MGVHTSYGEMWNGFTFKNISTIRTIDETYDAYSGKFAQNHNYCKEQDITFTHSSGATLKDKSEAISLLNDLNDLIGD